MKGLKETGYVAPRAHCERHVTGEAPRARRRIAAISFLPRGRRPSSECLSEKILNRVNWL
jgi:hypothetical protein